MATVCDAGSRGAPPAVQLMRLMYTSGTTDRPKAVMLTYENFYWKSADHVLSLGLNRDTRLLVTGPLYHVGALDLPGIAVLWQGEMLSIQRDFDARQCLAAIEADRLDAAWLAPVMTTSILIHTLGDAHLYLNHLEQARLQLTRAPKSRCP